MDNTFDNISIIKEENNFQNNRKSSKDEKMEKDNSIISRKISGDEFDFEKSLELSKIERKEEPIKQNIENDNNNTDINISLECSFLKPNHNIENLKKNMNENNENNNIRSVKTMPIKKIKKEDLDNIPLPIFSCIYCSNEKISFNHLSNEIISNKYLLQTSVIDMKQLDNLISFQPKIDKGDNTNKLLNIIINNSEYLKSFFNTDKIKEYFKTNLFIIKCQKNELIIKKAFKQRFEDNVIRKKKDIYFKGAIGLNKILKNSLNNKGLFNSNSSTNNHSALTGFIGNGQAVTQQFVEKNNNTLNGTNSSLLNCNSISLNNNEIGLVGKGNNMHYMENIMENNDKDIESQNTIEEKENILDFFCENDLKRKINKNDIEWEDNYYDVYNPIIEDDDILYENSKKDEYYHFNQKNNKNENKNKNIYETINISIDKKSDINNKPTYVNSENNLIHINDISKMSLNHNRKFGIFENNKSLGAINNSSNFLFKNIIRDKESRSLSLFLNGNKIINIQNNTSTIDNINCKNIKNKLISLSTFNTTNEKKLNECNRTPSFTKTRIIDLCNSSEKKLNSNRKSCIDLKNIHKKILFNYTANIKKELIDNNMNLKIKNVIHNNKRNNILDHKNMLNLNKNFVQIQNNSNNSNSNGNDLTNKYNLLLTKTSINNDHIYNKTLFNKTSNGFNKGNNLESKKFKRNFNALFKAHNNYDYSPLKAQLNNKKQVTFMNKKNAINIKNIEIDNNNFKRNKEFSNLRSQEKEINHRKDNNIISKNNYSAKKVNISLPQKIFINKHEIINKKKPKSSMKRGNVILIDLKNKS